MSDFGLIVNATEGSNEGPPVPNPTALIRGSATGGADGVVTIDTVYLTVTAPGFQPYVDQPYQRPSLQAPITVSLQRLAVSPTAYP